MSDVAWTAFWTGFWTNIGPILGVVIPSVAAVVSAWYARKSVKVTEECSTDIKHGQTQAMHVITNAVRTDADRVDQIAKGEGRRAVEEYKAATSPGMLGK